MNDRLRITSDMTEGFCIPWDAEADNNMFNIENLYKRISNTSSDICEHISTLNRLANLCSHITELGVRFGVSSVAFMYSNTILRSYDSYIQPEAEALFDAAKLNGLDVALIKANSLDIIDPEITDLLFIDTIHAYWQLKTELSLWENKVKKFIVLHDTVSFAFHDESMPLEELERWPLTDKRGLSIAIEEFLIEHIEWATMEHHENNNGLTVLVRNN